MPRYFIVDGDEQRSFHVERLDDGRFRVETPDETTYVVDAFEPEDGRLHMLFEDGDSVDVDVRHGGGTDFEVLVADEPHTLEVINERQRRMRAAGVGGARDAGPDLVSPMAGKVVALPAAPGDEVTEEDTVIIVEAMKMENDLKAHRPGRVTEIAVEVGQAVEIGDVLVTIEQDDEE
jgi:acetyl-CoA/propionyl-CoA carboxylase biotin carboxyl carrier protein